MTYITKKLAVQISEQQLITIEFAPRLDPNETEYTYQQPLFVFGEQVILKNNLFKPWKVVGMELVESKTPSGKLLNQPYWKYLVKDEQNTFCFDESALVRHSNTCSQCNHFHDYQEGSGKGWCNLFEVAARKHHLRTNDCDLYADKDPIDAPHARFAQGSVVKIIDSIEHHSEWSTFVVVARKYNHELYRSTESYLSEPDWYYLLTNPNYESTYDERLWVTETEICLFDESHLISTENIF